jgi:hypothetical protein
MTTKRSLQASLKAKRERLPHGYDVVKRKKKTAKKTTKRKAIRKRR